MAAGHPGVGDVSSDVMESMNSEEEREILDMIHRGNEKQLALLARRAEKAQERPRPLANTLPTRSPTGSGHPPQQDQDTLLMHP